MTYLRLENEGTRFYSYSFSFSEELRRVVKEWYGRLARQRLEQKRPARRPSHTFSPSGNLKSSYSLTDARSVREGL